MRIFLRLLLALALSLGFSLSALADEFDSNGVRIHYVVAGQGEPIILIHGLYSSALINWQIPGTFSDLAKHYRVIAFDCRGHGVSSKPKGDDQYGMQMVEDVTRLMDHLHISKACIVGYSMGGMIGMKFIALHQDRVVCGVLGGMGLLKSSSPLEQFWSLAKDKGTGDANPVPVACLRGLSKLGITPAQARSVRVPVTMIAGERDPCLALYVQPLHRLRPDWPVKIVHGVGHFDCIFSPDFKKQVLAAVAQ